MKQVKRYKILDMYECDYGSDGSILSEPTCIGSGDNKKEVSRIVSDYDLDCDGECYIRIFDRWTSKFIELEECE